MKKLLVILLILGSAIVHAQKIAMIYESGAKFQQVIDVDSTSASDLYKAVDKWIAKTYSVPDRVVKARVENEEIRGEGAESKTLVLSQAPRSVDNFHYSFKIEVKDNKVRYTMYDMRGSMNPVEAYIYKKDGTERTSGQAASVKNSATNIATILITSLELALKNKVKSDW